VGQQQLLLVVLVTIIVGTAVVVSLNILGESVKESNKDAVRSDILSIATTSQGWYQKIGMMGGGDRSFEKITFDDVVFAMKGVSDDGLTAWNENGTYVIDNRKTDAYTITGYPSSDDKYNSDKPLESMNGTALKAFVTEGDIEWKKN